MEVALRMSGENKVFHFSLGEDLESWVIIRVAWALG